MGAGTEISEGLATNRAQFTSHMYSQFRLKKNVRKSCAVAVCLLKGTAKGHCRCCVCWAAGPCGQHLTAHQCTLISFFSLKGRKVRPAHCYRDSVGQDGSFGGDFRVSLQSLLVIAGAAYDLALCSHQTPSGRLLLVLGMSLSGRAG